MSCEQCNYSNYQAPQICIFKKLNWVITDFLREDKTAWPGKISVPCVVSSTVRRVNQSDYRSQFDFLFVVSGDNARDWERIMVSSNNVAISPRSILVSAGV